MMGRGSIVPLILMKGHQGILSPYQIQPLQAGQGSWAKSFEKHKLDLFRPAHPQQGEGARQSPRPMVCPAT